MVVEILQVPQVRHRGSHVRVQVRRAVPGDLQADRGGLRALVTGRRGLSIA
jgi:hypothetical protein